MRIEEGMMVKIMKKKFEIREEDLNKWRIKNVEEK